MVLYSFISLIILLSIFISISLLGKCTSYNNLFFFNNSFATWIMGAIMYFTITFVVFIPFLFLQLNIIYFVIIFFIKEFFLYIFFISQRDKINNLPWKSLLWIVICGTIIAIVYKYGIVHFTKPDKIIVPNIFQSWIKFQNVIKYFSGIPVTFLENWVFSIISGTIIYTSIATWFVEFSKNHNYIEKCASLFFALISLLFFSLGIPLHSSIGIYLLLFLVLVTTRIIMYSRHKYGFLYGIISLVTWSFEPKLFLAILSLALITLFIYTFLNKPKISLFLIQLIVPNIILLSLQIIHISEWMVLALVLFSLILYFIFLFMGKNKWLDQLNKLIIKFKFAIPILILLTIIITFIILIVKSDINWQNIVTIHNPIFSNNKNNYVWSQVQLIIYSVTTIILLFWLIYWLINKSKITKTKILFSIVALVILFVYNPMVDLILLHSFLEGQMKFLKSIIFIPITSFCWIKIIHMLKKKS